MPAGTDPTAGGQTVGAEETVSALVLDTAAGRLILEASPHGLARIEHVGPDVTVPGAVTWFNVKHGGRAETGSGGDNRDDDGNDPVRPAGAAGEHLARTARQIAGYLSGRRREFDVPIDWEAAGVHDEFAREVYREIRHVPYGQTSTYGQISADAGRPRNARRVGRLCALVPVPFVIPVHRIIRADGGMGACPDHRLLLLDHERRNLTTPEPVGFPV